MAKSKKNSWVLWSEDELKLLRRLFPKVRAREIADQIGRRMKMRNTKMTICFCLLLLIYVFLLPSCVSMRCTVDPSLQNNNVAHLFVPLYYGKVNKIDGKQLVDCNPPLDSWFLGPGSQVIEISAGEHIIEGYIGVLESHGTFDIYCEVPFNLRLNAESGRKYRVKMHNTFRCQSAYATITLKE